MYIEENTNQIMFTIFIYYVHAIYSVILSCVTLYGVILSHFFLLYLIYGNKFFIFRSLFGISEFFSQNST